MAWRVGIKMFPEARPWLVYLTAATWVVVALSIVLYNVMLSVQAANDPCVDWSNEPTPLCNRVGPAGLSREDFVTAASLLAAAGILTFFSGIIGLVQADKTLTGTSAGLMVFLLAVPVIASVTGLSLVASTYPSWGWAAAVLLFTISHAEAGLVSTVERVALSGLILVGIVLGVGLLLFALVWTIQGPPTGVNNAGTIAVGAAAGLVVLAGLGYVAVWVSRRQDSFRGGKNED